VLRDAGNVYSVATVLQLFLQLCVCVNKKFGHVQLVCYGPLDAFSGRCLRKIREYIVSFRHLWNRGFCGADDILLVCAAGRVCEVYTLSGKIVGRLDSCHFLHGLWPWALGYLNKRTSPK
jgi:hypothetical protein